MKQKIIMLFLVFSSFGAIEKARAQCGYWGGFSSYSITNTTITLHWDVDPNNGAYESYRILARKHNFFNPNVWQVVSGTVNIQYSPYTITGLVANTDYDIEIQRYCNGVYENSSTPLGTITTASSPTTTVSGATVSAATGITNTSAYIPYTFKPITIPGSRHDDVYILYKKTGAANWSYGAIGDYTYVTQNGRTYVLPYQLVGLTAGTAYTVYVQVDYTLNPGETYATSHHLGSNEISFTTTGYGPANPGPPIAKATTAAVLAFGTTSTTLTGSASSQPFKTLTLSYNWQQMPTYLTYVNGVLTSNTPSFAWPTANTSANTPVIDLKSGKYVYQLTVTNSNNKSSKTLVHFEVLAECGSHKGNYNVPVVTKAGTDFYNGTVYSSTKVVLPNVIHTFKGYSVALYPGFESTVTGVAGAFNAIAFDKTKCAGYTVPTARSGTLNNEEEEEYTEPYVGALVGPQTGKKTELLQQAVEKSSFSIYPNPTTGLLSIQLPLATESIKQIQFTNELGETVFKTNSNATSLDISNFSSGLYFYRVQTDKEIYTGKVLKQ
jgi:Secretion system C-terminal sorting domain/Fibronectin type III domain